MTAADAEAERLLAAQLSDLVRFRQILEAQRAVLRMEDAGLLDAFSREADGIVASISARDVQLMAIRAAVTPSVAPQHHELQVRIEKERHQAGAEAQALARQMEESARGVARDLAESTTDIQGLLTGYANRRGSSASAPLFERTG